MKRMGYGFDETLLLMCSTTKKLLMKVERMFKYVPRDAVQGILYNFTERSVYMGHDPKPTLVSKADYFDENLFQFITSEFYCEKDGRDSYTLIRTCALLGLDADITIYLTRTKDVLNLEEGKELKLGTCSGKNGRWTEKMAAKVDAGKLSQEKLCEEESYDFSLLKQNGKYFVKVENMYSEQIKLFDIKIEKIFKDINNSIKNTESELIR